MSRSLKWAARWESNPQMATKRFVNLPVTELERSEAFFKSR
jgi:hypothetical protein